MKLNIDSHLLVCVLCNQWSTHFVNLFKHLSACLLTCQLGFKWQSTPSFLPTHSGYTPDVTTNWLQVVMRNKAAAESARCV